MARILTRQLQQELPEEVRAALPSHLAAQLTTLPLPMIEGLSEALFDFNRLASRVLQT
jgi:hypothetical protein